jgi:hypothetical protein
MTSSVTNDHHTALLCSGGTTICWCAMSPYEPSPACNAVLPEPPAWTAAAVMGCLQQCASTEQHHDLSTAKCCGLLKL